jgi:ribonuclease HI
LFEFENESLEWRSVTEAVQHIDVRAALPLLDKRGIVAYTDGACIKNPGGPAGWAALLWAAFDFIDGRTSAINRLSTDDAACIECSGHVPRSATTTNNRVEIAAVLAVLSIAPPDLPLTIFSDSEYVINVAQGIYQMKANTDLWAWYRTLLGKRKVPPTFEWVRGHMGQKQNERADELAGIAAWHGDIGAYHAWQASMKPEAHNTLPAAEMTALKQQVQKLKTLFDGVTADSLRVGANERQFIDDMAKRLQKNRFVPSEKQANWVKVLARKYKV